mmetsp:Transcript_4729/g.8084  ORF Transcript_4729/g.8084 Transcript_4729/m.8084 type:complete len:314 (-) Transcript_4729:38-979(-)
MQVLLRLGRAELYVRPAHGSGRAVVGRAGRARAKAPGRHCAPWRSGLQRLLALCAQVDRPLAATVAVRPHAFHRGPTDERHVDQVHARALPNVRGRGKLWGVTALAGGAGDRRARRRASLQLRADQSLRRVCRLEDHLPPPQPQVCGYDAGASNTRSGEQEADCGQEGADGHHAAVARGELPLLRYAAQEVSRRAAVPAGAGGADPFDHLLQDTDEAHGGPQRHVGGLAVRTHRICRDRLSPAGVREGGRVWVRRGQAQCAHPLPLLRQGGAHRAALYRVRAQPPAGHERVRAHPPVHRGQRRELHSRLGGGA